MSGSIEIAKCGTCKQIKPVTRKYYHYDINCDCCNTKHFEIAYHCSDCEPIEPSFTKIQIETSKLTKIDL